MISWHGFQWGLGIFDNSPCEPAYPYNYKVWWCSSSQQCNNSDSSTVTALSCTIGGRQTSTTDMLQALFYNYLIWSVRSHCFHSKDYCLFRGTEKLNNTWVLNDLLWPAIPRALQFICRKCTQIRPFISPIQTIGGDNLYPSPRHSVLIVEPFVSMFIPKNSL